MSLLIEDYYPFPEGKWVVEITGAQPMGFEGGDLVPTEFGLFMTHRPISQDEETRQSFVPWARVMRAYTVNEP